MMFVRLYPTASTASANDKLWVKLSSQEPVQEVLAGTWVFNSTITFTGTAIRNIPLEFVSANTNFAYMTIGPGTEPLNRMIYYKAEGTSGLGTRAFYHKAFTNTAFQTVEISTTFAELSANYKNADLVLAFLQANARKQ